MTTINANASVIDTTAIVKKLAAVAEQELRAQIGTLVENYTRYEQTHTAFSKMCPFIETAPRVRDPQQEFIASLQRDIASKDARIAELEALCFKNESEKEPFTEKDQEKKTEKRTKNKSIIKIEESTTRLTVEAERLARLETERLAVEAERLSRLETERLARLETERLSRQAERLARLETERLSRLETERLAAEAERLTRLETERQAKEEADKLVKLEEAKLAAEWLVKLEEAKLEKERFVKLEAERLAAEAEAEETDEDYVDDSSRLKPEDIEEVEEVDEVESAEEVEETVIGGKKYFVSSKTNTVYKIDKNGDPGDEVGTLVNNKIVAAKK